MTPATGQIPLTITTYHFCLFFRCFSNIPYAKDITVFILKHLMHLNLIPAVIHVFVCFVCFVALRPKSTAMVIAERSVHLTTLFPGQA